MLFADFSVKPKTTDRSPSWSTGTLQESAPGTHSKLFRSDSQSHGKRGCMKMEEECEKQDMWVKMVIKGIVVGRERREVALMNLIKKISYKESIREWRDASQMWGFFLVFLWMSPKVKDKSIYFEWLILLWNSHYPGAGMFFPMSVWIYDAIVKNRYWNLKAVAVSHAAILHCVCLSASVWTLRFSSR